MVLVVRLMVQTVALLKVMSVENRLLMVQTVVLLKMMEVTLVGLMG